MVEGLTFESNGTEITHSVEEEHEEQGEIINGHHRDDILMQVLVGQHQCSSDRRPGQNLPRAQLCVDTIKKSIVKIHILESPTGELIKCGSGCIVDSALGLVVTGGRILRQLAYLRRFKNTPDHSVMPIIELAETETRREKEASAGISTSSETETKVVHRRIFTGVMILCHKMKHQEVCVLRLGQNIDLSSTISLPVTTQEGVDDHHDTKNPEENAEKKKKRRSPLRAVAALLSCMNCKSKRVRDTLPLPILLYPISYSQLYALPEIRIAKSNSISDPDTTMTGYFSGRTKPFWASSKYFNLRNENDRSSCSSKKKKKKKMYPTLLMESKFSLDTQIVGSVFINSDGEIAGLISSYVHVESGFALACGAGYHVIGAKMLRKAVQKARRYCEQ